MASRLELWGGHECTFNRVGDRYLDQSALSGHEHRPEDLDRFAELGVSALRYPVLWEKVETTRRVRDFAWSDDRLARLQALGLRPIVGLVHHGSGPRWTSLVDEGFAEGLAAHAGAVAERYPWVDAYTPVNEPLTTARFAALYGHWYPHLRDERSSWLALLNEIDATRLAMRAIRQVNPSAQLVQTDDLGHCQSTPRLAYQAEFENERRWLTWDLLCGRVTPGHPMHGYLCGQGFEDRLAAIADDLCPPDVIGVNHYPTSERFLDHAVDAYPPELRGGNGREAYVDVEAVRVSASGILGFEGVLEQAWRRYGIPVAVTECHNGCTREEQLRWLVECWQGAERLRAKGCGIVAVTPWALLGSHDWDSLLTQERGCYETGVFDLRGAAPRPTALAKLLPKLARGERLDHPALTTPGWWRRDIRFTLGRRVKPAQAIPPRKAKEAPARPLLITGATGTLGQAFARACDLRGLPYVLTRRDQLAIEDPTSTQRMLDRLDPWAIVNTAGWVRVDDAEREADACLLANAEGPRVLAGACADAGVRLVTFSSDLVFDGAKASVYVESDATSPLNVYGLSKVEAERAVLESGAEALVVRTAAFFQAADPHNFGVHALRALGEGRPFAAADDLVVSPTFVPDLVHAALDLLVDEETGVWHLTNAGAVTWAEFARRLAEAAGLDPKLVEGRPAETFDWPAARPKQTALDSERARLLPSLDSAIERFVHDHRTAVQATRSACPPLQSAA